MVDVGLPVAQIRFIANKTKVSYAQLVSRLKKILEYVWDNTEIETKDWIAKHVPKRTGQLQDALVEALEQSYIKNSILRFTLGVINEARDYAKDVDEMNQSKVRHFMEWGYAYYYGHHGKIQLNDPRAFGGFWDKLMTYMMDRITRHIAIAKELYIGAAGKENVMLRRQIT
jgi:hypothetical protein